MVGNFEVPVTSNLRECFSRIHDEASGSLPSDQQFNTDEQYTMYQLCWVFDDNDKVIATETEVNILELMHYLSGFGLTGQQVLADIRCYSASTSSLAMRLHFAAHRRGDATEQKDCDSKIVVQDGAAERSMLEGIFLAPSFEKSTAA